MKKVKSVNRLARNRTRSLGLLASHSLTYRGGPKVPLAQSYAGSIATGALSGNYKVMSDIVTPGFRDAVRRGLRINNPYSSIQTTHVPYIAQDYYHASNEAWENVSGPVVSWVCGRIENNIPASGIAEINLSKIATVEAWAGVEPAKSQSLVTMLEAHKTWATIHDRAVKLAKIVNAVRRKDLRALKALMPNTPRRPMPTKMVLWDDDGRPLLTRRGRPQSYRKSVRVVSTSGVRDRASQLWLEYRYGWCPLVYDMIDSMKAIYAADLRSELLPRDILISRSRKEAKNTVTTTATKVAGGLQYYTNCSADFEWSVRTYIHYRWKAPDGILRRINDFGLFDVPRAVWEIVPFSFIADWFVPIGDWLGALTPKIGVEYLDMGFVVRRKTTAFQEITGFPAINPPGAPVNSRWTIACPVGSRDSYSYETIQRSTYLGIPYFPPIDVKLNVKRMADVAALFKSIR